MSEKSDVHLPGRACNFLLMSCERLEQVIREAGPTPSQGSHQETEARPQSLPQGAQPFGQHLCQGAELKSGVRVSNLSQDLLIDLDPLPGASPRLWLHSPCLSRGCTKSTPLRALGETKATTPAVNGISVAFPACKAPLTFVILLALHENLH